MHPICELKTLAKIKASTISATNIDLLQGARKKNPKLLRVINP